MRILRSMKRAALGLLGIKPSLISRSQIATYAQICNTIIERLASKSAEDGGLYPVESAFVTAVTDHADNCVWVWNSAIRKDLNAEMGSKRSVKQFWGEWDKTFATVATKRGLPADDYREWQHQLYVLALFRGLAHFRNVIDDENTPVDPLTVYQREAQEFDLRNVLEEVIEAEKFTDLTLPAPAKNAATAA